MTGIMICFRQCFAGQFYAPRSFGRQGQVPRTGRRFKKVNEGVWANECVESVGPWWK